MHSRSGKRKQASVVRAASALLLAVFLLGTTGAVAAANKCTPNLANVPKVSFPQHPDWQIVYDFAWSNWKRLILNNRKMYNQCWMDEGFGAGGATWQWDTNFGSIGARWGFTEFPVIETQENFYFAQQANGLIGQKLSEQSESFKATSLNPPFYAWVEWEYYLMTGDAAHFSKVINGIPVYQRLRNHFYYFWNNTSLHKADGSWVWSGIDSGRDCVSAGLWVDLPAQMATTAFYLAKIAQVVGDSNLYADMLSRHRELTGFLNANHWNGLRNYYENRNTNGSFITNQDGPQGLWTLIGRVPDTRQLGLLSAQILDPAKLFTYHPVPSVSRESPYYNAGCKWYGPTWPPDVITTIKGLSEQGQHAAAFAVAQQDVEKTVRTYRSNGGHVCENYRSDRDGCYGGQDLTWGSAAYVVSLLDIVMGLRPNAPDDALAWTINLLEPYSISNLRFRDNTVSLAYQGRNGFADGVRLTINTTSAFKLTVNVPERVENGITIPARSCGPQWLLIGNNVVECPAP